MLDSVASGGIEPAAYKSEAQVETRLSLARGEIYSENLPATFNLMHGLFDEWM